jgi:phosphoribosyl 1,2-cyclic phosphodiesterase
MSLRFCNLGSGSSGNASYLEADGYGVLLDVGLGPRRLSRGLADADRAWEQVRAAILTHTHGDHWTDNTLKHLLQRRIPLFCHRRHLPTLRRQSAYFALMENAGLATGFVESQTLEFGPFQCRPFEVPHDDEPTCGFRIDCPAGSLGYAADLGCWTKEIAGHLLDVDILAVEFNHDVALERNSGRSPMLVDRVLGDRGHLSNDQAAELVTHVLRHTEPGRTRHLVLLHLSRQCNHPRLAHDAAKSALADHGRGVAIHVARHNAAGPVLTSGRRPRASVLAQPLLPGWE